MRFAYARRGGPMLEWDGRSPPSAARAGETRSLGSLDVPRAGAPEIVSGYESPEPGAATIHLGADPAPAPAPAKFDLGLIRKASALAAGYHGVRRNNGSIFWGLIWAAAAFISPLYGTLVPAFAMAQGFGEARPKSNPAKRRRSGAQTVRGKRSAKMKYRSRMASSP